MHARGEVGLKVEHDANLATLQAVILGCTSDERRCVAWDDAIMEAKAGSDAGQSGEEARDKGVKC